jgi:DNA-binding HxlR family transcriptional regulator
MKAGFRTNLDKETRGNIVEVAKFQEQSTFGMKVYAIDNSLKIFAQKYALHIIRNMLVLNQSRFNQFLRSIEGINTKTLSIRLREMEGSGLIKRTIINTRPVQTEYSLTDKGKALEPILSDIDIFSTKFESETIFKESIQRKNEVFRTEHLPEIYDY